MLDYPGAKYLMTISFSLGLGQVQNELVLMQSPGCYWMTVNRQDDAPPLIHPILSAQRSLALIGTAGNIRHLLAAIPQADGHHIPRYTLPETPEALVDLSAALSRTFDDEPRLLLFYTTFSTWESLSSAEFSRWLKEMQTGLSARNSTLLIITAGAGVDGLRDDLKKCYRHLDGLSHLEWQQESWNYRVQWWSNNSVMLVDQSLRLTLLDDSFIQRHDAAQTLTLASEDEPLYLAEKSVLAGTLPLSGIWMLFDDNSQLASAVQVKQASAATVIFNLHANEQIVTLAGDIHRLRRTCGSTLKMVVREMQATLRYSDERLLLACGVNLIVPFDAPLPRFLTTLEGLQGQKYHRHVAADLGILLNSMQPLQEKGYLPLAHFCRCVTQLIENPLLPEKGKGLLVALCPAPEFSPEQAITLCRPRRYGDLFTRSEDRLYLFLTSCREADLETALHYIFGRPSAEIFSQRMTWFEDVQILAEVRKIDEMTPGD